MPYWLMKSEPDDVSIDDLAAMPEQTVAWYGVRPGLGGREAPGAGRGATHAGGAAR